MQLDFPNNPTPGQIFLATNNVAYQWDPIKTKWFTRLAPLEGGITNPGPNPPANPVVGTLWWDNVGGQLYTWYDDGDSAQWIETSPIPD